MSFSTVHQHQLDRGLVWSGFKQLLPISLFVTVFGAAYGLAASQVGVDNSITLAMSALVFSGYAQFALLDMWGTTVPLVPMCIAALAINARHLLMGATLYPWLQRLSPVKRYGVMVIASDANWAMAINAFERGKPGFGLLVGGGLAIWAFWVVGTWIGVCFGGLVENPERYGLDMVMGCFLVAMAVGGDVKIRSFAIWAAAAISSLAAYHYLPEHSHIVVGTLCGGIVGVFLAGDSNEH